MQLVSTHSVGTLERHIDTPQGSLTLLDRLQASRLYSPIDVRAPCRLDPDATAAQRQTAVCSLFDDCPTKAKSTRDPWTAGWRKGLDGSALVSALEASDS